MGRAGDLEEVLEELARRERELAAVHRIVVSLHARTDLEELIRQTLLAAIETVEGSAGSILLYDAESDRLVFRYVVGPAPEITELLTGRAMDPGDGIAGAVFQTGRGVAIEDVSREPRHHREIDLATHHTTRTLVTAPLKTTQGRPIGVMQILNRRAGIFDAADLAVLEILSGHAASAIETATLHTQLLRSEVDKKRFTRQVLRCVTGGKLQVVDRDEIPTTGELVLEVSVGEPDWYPTLRKTLQQTAEEAGMSPDAAGELILAVGEATTNAVKHAEGGRCAIYRTPQRIIARIWDRGKGIRPDDLPAAVLQAGYSTKVSLGMGYTVMLKMADHVWLATGPDGTTVQLEKWIHPEEHAVNPLDEVLKRFG